jgi:hypothetical protein
MSEELKDEAICTAHSSILCSKRSSYSYELRACGLETTGDRPYTSECDYRLVIKAPVVKEEPLPEIPVLTPITSVPANLVPDSEYTPF